MEMNFCRRCGTPLTQISQASYRCGNSHSIFLNSAPGVGLFLFDNDDNILLSVRAIDPDKGSLDAFGGFVDGNETFEEALEREVEEELALHLGDYTKPMYLTSMSSTYNYGGEDCPVLSVFYYAYLQADANPIPGDDVAKIYRSHVDDIDLTRVGGQDVRNGLKFLRKRKSAGFISRPA